MTALPLGTMCLCGNDVFVEVSKDQQAKMFTPLCAWCFTKRPYHVPIRVPGKDQETARRVAHVAYQEAKGKEGTMNMTKWRNLLSVAHPDKHSASWKMFYTAAFQELNELKSKETT